ncbi:MAG: phosphoribosylanthranilate isomerase [Polyangiaceae bacterium]|nr:phosphoribosylanthranilate isomerase [Polyangiaceae bacterium]
MTPPLDSFHVKICGITRPVDAELAIAAGADMLGLNFVPSSPRCIDVACAQAIARVVLGRARIVGVFADADEARIRSIADDVPLDLVQLHGDEPPELVATLGPRAFKAVAVGSADDVEFAKTYPGDLLLVDARVVGQRGGTGVRIDPALVAPLARERPILLAGGLKPDNVAEAIRHVAPRGVDVASGVESAPGIKDEGMMRRFVAEARRAAREVFDLLT